MWHANLLHGGAPQRDTSRTRHSQVTHYFFEGCRYWTPMLSDDEDTQWRDPEWISEEEAEAARLAGRYDMERIREMVQATVPQRATVLVISTGDDQLLELGDRQALHFLQDERGDYAGYNPADSDAAIAALEEQRERGASHVLIPRAAFWWLEYYRESESISSEPASGWYRRKTASCTRSARCAASAASSASTGETPTRPSPRR